MQKTPHLNLHILPASEESTKTAREFMRELGDDQATSNMMIIDSAIADLTDGVAKAESDIKTAKQEAISTAASDATAKASAAEAAAKAASRPITWMPTATDVEALSKTGDVSTGGLTFSGNGSFGEGASGINFVGSLSDGEGLIGYLDDATVLNGMYGDTAPSIGIGVRNGNINPVFLRISSNISDKSKMLQIGPQTGEKYKVYHEGYKPTVSDIGAAAPSKVTNFTLTAAGWTGSAAPYTQTVTATGVTANSNGTVGVADNATDAQWTAAGKAQIRKTAQTANSLTIKAYGEKPAIDIPCSVTIVG